MAKRAVGLRNVKQDNAGKALVAIGGVLAYCGMITMLSARRWFTCEEFVNTLKACSETSDSTK